MHHVHTHTHTHRFASPPPSSVSFSVSSQSSSTSVAPPRPPPPSYRPAQPRPVYQPTPAPAPGLGLDIMTAPKKTPPPAQILPINIYVEDEQQLGQIKDILKPTHSPWQLKQQTFGDWKTKARYKTPKASKGFFEKLKNKIPFVKDIL